MLSGLAKTSRSLSFRLTLWHAGLLVAAAVAALGTVYVELRNLTIARERETIDLRLGFLEAVYSRGGLDSVSDLVRRAEAGRDAAFFIQVTDAANRTLFSSNSPQWQPYTDGKLDHAPMPAPGRDAWTSLEGEDGTLRLAARRLGDDNVLRVGRATVESRRVLNAYEGIALTSLSILFPISLASGWFLSRRALSPLSTLTLAVQEIVATGRFSARVPTRGTGDEIDELVIYFNVMLERIEKLMTGLAESLDFAAHDLRTPLTRLRNSAEAALRDPLDQTALADALVACVEESERVLVTVRRLIELAAAEGGVARFERTPVDFLRLATEVMDLYREIAESKDVEVSVEASGSLVAQVDLDAFRRVISNVLDNAIKYTRLGTPVSIRLRRVDDEVVLDVADCGEGIAAEDLPHVWDRLYRARSSSAQPGSGLGLSIVRAVVEAHGGSVGARSEPGKGSVFTIRVPTG